MTTEERLDALELELAITKRRNRWLLAVVGSAIVVVGLAWTLTKITPTARAQEADAGPKVVRANHFILEDESGHVRARLAVNEGVTELGLFDENGTLRVWLGTGKTWPALHLFDENGAKQVSLRAGGKLLGSTLSLFDENGTKRVDLKSKGAELRLSDENDNVRARLFVTEGVGPMLVMTDEYDHPIWFAPLMKGGMTE